MGRYWRLAFLVVSLSVLQPHARFELSERGRG